MLTALGKDGPVRFRVIIWESGRSPNGIATVPSNLTTF